MGITRTTSPGAGRTRDDGRGGPSRTSGVAAALAVGVVVSGCASPASAVGTHTARVMIDGSTLTEQPSVVCTQTGWSWVIETVEKSPGFTAQVQTGAEVTPLSVQITDLNGFTGGFSNATFGTAKATIADGTFTISGSAEGTFAEGKSNKPATASFEIRTSC